MLHAYWFRRREGFTLIELLAVIALLAILILVAVPIITQNLNEAKKTTCETNIKMINSAIQRYYFDKGSYPSKVSDLVTAGYLDEEPQCPFMPESDPDYGIKADRVNIEPHKDHLTK